MFVLVPKGKERKEGKGAGRRNAVYLPIAGKPRNHDLTYLSHKVFVHSRLYVTWSCSSITRDHITEDVFCCILVSNVTTLMMIYLLFPENVFLPHFLILAEEDRAKFSLCLF